MPRGVGATSPPHLAGCLTLFIVLSDCLVCRVVCSRSVSLFLAVYSVQFALEAWWSVETQIGYLEYQDQLPERPTQQPRLMRCFAVSSESWGLSLTKLGLSPYLNYYRGCPR